MKRFCSNILRDAVQVAGGDPQENPGVDQWKLNVVDETNSAMKLANANSVVCDSTPVQHLR